MSAATTRTVESTFIFKAPESVPLIGSGMFDMVEDKAKMVSHSSDKGMSVNVGNGVPSNKRKDKKEGGQ